MLDRIILFGMSDRDTTDPKFTKDENGQWHVEWPCPMCGAPATEKVASDNLKDFLAMFKKFHPYQTFCPDCLMAAAKRVDKTLKHSRY